MIIVKSPLRLTFGGGGTDLPSYYTNFEGHLISATINKYVYVSVSRPFLPGIKLNYSQTESISTIDEVNHPIIREALHILKPTSPQIEITSFADIPAGTGLGSSGSFTTALLVALHQHYHVDLSTSGLAELACEIEIDKLQQPIGRQDQYTAAYGGLNSFHFAQDGTVKVSKLKIDWEVRKKLERNLLLFFTGYSRSANKVLAEQDMSTKSDVNNSIVKNLHRVKAMGFEAQHFLEKGDLNSFGQQMNEHWQLKKSRSHQMSNERINHLYELGLKNGALGGKLVGAGGGGFLLFYCEYPEKLITAMGKEGLRPLYFNFDELGTRSISV